MVICDYITYSGLVEQLQTRLGEECGYLEILRSRPDLVEKLNSLNRRLADKDFHVLIVGQFNAGKSTFVNSLLGDNILPAKMLPATALITQLRYGEQKRITIFPKPDQPRFPRPFEIPPAELKSYVLIQSDVENGEKIDTPFDHVEVEWPLPILKDCVQIIDSPGLNDPESYDKVTMDYLDNADGIVYVIPCQKPGDKTDIATIELLNEKGYKSIIYVLTFFDIVQRDSPDDVPEFIQHTRQLLGKYTDLAESIYFVNSRGGLAAKIAGDRQALQTSGVAGAEEGLEHYLVQRKGADKLGSARDQLISICENGIKAANEQLANADVPLAEFERRVSEVQTKLNLAQQKANTLSHAFETGFRSIMSEVQGKARLYLSSSADRVDAWVENYDSPKSVSLIHLKSSVGSIVDDYVAHIDEKFKFSNAEWGNKVLIPFLKPSMTELAQSLETMVDDLESTVSDIKVDLSFASPDTGHIPDGQGSSTATKIGLLLYGLATMDWGTAAMGGIFGLKGFARTLVTELTAGVAVGLISMFTPVGMAGLVVAFVAAIIAGVGWNVMSVKKEIKKKLKDEYRKAYSDPAKIESGAEKMTAAIREKMQPLVEEVRASANADIEQIRKDIEFQKQEKSKKGAEISLRKKELQTLILKFEDLIGTLQTFGE